MEYNKLVRDYIPDILEELGLDFEVTQVTDYEVTPYLYKKLDEEVQEFKDSDSLEEIVDILEVLLTITSKYGYSIDELLEMLYSKRREKGGFKENFILKSIKEDYHEKF